MSRFGKVVAVAAVAGSVAWVGHQAVRHHHKAERLHGEFVDLMNAVSQRSQPHDNEVVQDFVDFKQHDARQEWRHPAEDSHSMVGDGGEWRGPADDSDSLSRLPDDRDFSGEKAQWGRPWGHHKHEHEEDQHSDSDDEHEHWGRRHRRGCHKHAHASTDDHERQTWAAARQKWHEEVKAKLEGITVVEVTTVSAPQEEVGQAENAEQPQVLVDPMPPVPALEDNNEVQDNGQDSDAGRHGSWHHRRHEHNFRQFESSLTDQERAEFRRLRREARRLHGDAVRGAGAFVAGAAFVGGVAHLRRLRRERREAAGSAAACKHACGGEAAVGEVTNGPSETNA